MTKKPSLYLIPGFLCDDTVWQQQIKALSTNAQIIVPGSRGMTSFEEIAQSILANAPEKFSVVGHSMGGRIAFELLHLAEHRIDKFAVLSTAVHPLQKNEETDRQALVDFAKKEGMEAFAKHWTKLITNYEEKENPLLTNAVQQMAASFTQHELECQIQTLLSRNDQSQYLNQFEKEVLLICGEDDHWSPVAQHEQMAKKIKHATMIKVKNAGHMLTLEQANEVSAILLNCFYH